MLYVCRLTHVCCCECVGSLAVTCPCTPDKAASLRYAHKLCTCDMSRRILFFRHSLSELDEKVESCTAAVAEAKKREGKEDAPAAAAAAEEGATDMATD